MITKEQETKRLKLFSDLSLTSTAYPTEPILYPFKGPIYSNTTFENYINSGHTIFEFSSLEDADFAVLPINWENILSLRQIEDSVEFVRRAKKNNTITVSFFGGDCSHLDLPIETDLIFRQSLYDFIRKPNDFVLPAWNEDILKNYCQGRLAVRHKSNKPVVGFCGFANPTKLSTYTKYHLVKVFGRLKEKLWNIKSVPPYSCGHILRKRALAKLLQSPEVETNFVRRDKSFFSPKNKQQTVKQQRSEFVRNLLESDYILCPRGSGNYSIRFYEALCCGRIPIIINTHCVLPYDSEIDWRRYCVWIEESELCQIGQKILEFHQRLSPDDFVELQHQCRQLWENYIEPFGFFKSLCRQVEVAKTSRIYQR